MPKMNSLNSEASILPRRMSADFEQEGFELGQRYFVGFMLPHANPSLARCS